MQSSGSASGGPSVLCVGLATLDHVLAIDGDIEVGRKHLATRHDVVGGGPAANAAVTVARLEGRATLVSCVGQDAVGDVVRAGLRDDGVDIDLVRRVDAVATPFSTIVVSSSGARTIFTQVPGDLFERPCPSLDEVRCDAVLVDGRWPTGSEAALRHARRLGVPGVVDVDRQVTDPLLRAAIFGLASHLVFSADALTDSTGCSGAEDGLRTVAAATTAHLAVTLGEQGVVWLDDGDARRMEAFRVDVTDTAGAGDVFHGAFTLALAEGATEEAAIRFGAAAAALKCQAPGARAGIPHRAAVDDFLEDRSVGSPAP